MMVYCTKQWIHYQMWPTVMKCLLFVKWLTWYTEWALKICYFLGLCLGGGEADPKNYPHTMMAFEQIM